MTESESEWNESLFVYFPHQQQHTEIHAQYIDAVISHQLDADRRAEGAVRTAWTYMNAICTTVLDIVKYSGQTNRTGNAFVTSV